MTEQSKKTAKSQEEIVASDYSWLSHKAVNSELVSHLEYPKTSLAQKLTCSQATYEKRLGADIPEND